MRLSQKDANDLLFDTEFLGILRTKFLTGEWDQWFTLGQLALVELAPNQRGIYLALIYMSYLQKEKNESKNK